MNRLRGYWRSKHTRLDQTGDEHLGQLAESASDLARLLDKEHDEFILQRLLELIEPESSPAAWHAFHHQTVDGPSAAQAAAELCVSPNAVLIAKSRILRRLRQEAAGLID